MRFYTKQHSHYCGIDLHTRTMYLCILNQAGAIVLHRNMRADPDSLLKAIAPFRQDIVVAVECIFTWYWLADLCAAYLDRVIVASSSRDREADLSTFHAAQRIGVELPAR